VVGVDGKLRPGGGMLSRVFERKHVRSLHALTCLRRGGKGTAPTTTPARPRKAAKEPASRLFNGLVLPLQAAPAAL
jgi:hypothetical protein